MHIQIVNFSLNQMTDAQYQELCDTLAPKFGEVAGLMFKYWLADATSNTYGGVYVWESRAAMDAYLRTDLATAVMSHPSLSGITSSDFDVLDAPTRVTRGLPKAA